MLLSATRLMREGNMKTWPWMMVCATVVLAGCRTDPRIALLEREMRQLEDKNYQLQFTLEDSQRALQQCRQGKGPGATRSGMDAAAAANDRAPARPATEPSGAPTTVAPPDVEFPTTPGQAIMPDTLRTPSTPALKAAPAAPPTPPPTAPPASAPTRGPVPGPAPKFTPSSQSRPAAEPSLGRVPTIDSSLVHSIALNRALTGGYRPAGRPADEGVSVFVELRDARGRPVRATGPISVVLLDRQEKGEAARVGRWDFSAQETATQFTQAMEGQGIHLEMPWSDSPPAHDRLQVHVRFTTTDGRKLEAHQAIEVQLRDQAAQRTPDSPILIAPATITPSDVAPVAASEPEARASVDDREGPATSAPPSRAVKPVARPAWAPYR